MLQDPICLSREVEIFITVHFRLGFDIAPMRRSEREKVFPGWAEKLNAEIPSYNWSCVSFPEDAPETIKDRKSVFLQGRSKDTGPLILWVKDLLRNEKSFEVTRVEETVWYYDWGLGAEDFTFIVNVRKEEDIRSLSDLAEKISSHIYFTEYKIKVEMKDNEQEFKTALFENWDRSSRILLDMLGEGGKKGNLGAGEESLCGWTEIYHFALIVKTAGKEGMLLNGQQVKDMMGSFSGETVKEDRDYISIPGIHASVEGMDGTVAILDADYKTDDSNYFNILERVKWIYRLAILFYANLNNYVDRLADRMFECQNTETKNPREDLKRFRNERLQLQLFLNESSPRTVAVDDATTQKIFNGVWEACQGNETVEEVNYQLNYLQSYYADSISLESSWLQTKMNYILFLLNIMIFATVIANLIVTYDIKNEAIHPSLRLLLIAAGAGLFGVLSLLIIFREWGYKKSKR